MKYASDELKNEHEGILFRLNILEKMIKLIQENQKVNIADVSAMLNFLKLFADKCHHGKEEGLLFPAIEIAGINKENTILFPMGDKLLTVETHAKLLESLEEYEDRVMGKGTHEKLHEMLHDFTKIYL